MLYKVQLFIANIIEYKLRLVFSPKLPHLHVSVMVSLHFPPSLLASMEGNLDFLVLACIGLGLIIGAIGNTIY